MASKSPLAFLSYAHSDDEHENGRLREFARRLSSEVRLQWGEEFPIFIDRNELKWGQEWKARIEQSVDGVTFLVPIVTPGYMKSEWCRKEFLRFVEREKQLKRNDLILPVYYVRVPALDDEAKRSQDELANVLHERQYKDWRRFRHEPWTAPEVGRQFEQMALEIVEALERGGLVQPVVVAQTITSSVSHATTVIPRGSPNEPPIVTVDAMHRGNYTSIAEAIKMAKPGTRILVRPGHYREGLVMDKVLEILGEGNREDIVIEATGVNVVNFNASMGRVANLTLRQAGGSQAYGVHIAQGRLDLEDCDVTSRSLAAIAVRAGAEPRVRRNYIHHCAEVGIFVYENAAGLLEDNEVFRTTLAGMEISEGSSPAIRRNRIHECQTGIHVKENAVPLIEENDVFANAFSGIAIKKSGNPTVRRNRIHDNKECGCHIYENGAGLIEDNDVLSNGLSGFEVREGGNPVVRNNRIRGNREGIRVHKGGSGTFEGNTLAGNVARGNWVIANDCVANVKRSGNIEE